MNNLQTKKLVDICRLITDGIHNSPAYVAEGVPMLDSKNIDDNFNINDSSPQKFISRETDELLSKRCKPVKDDILISSRGSIGKIAIVDNGQDFNIMGNIILIRVNDEVNPRFLAYYLRSKFKTLELIAHGSSQKGLYLNQVRDLKIPLFPITEQNHLVATLDQIGSLHKKRKQTVNLLDQYIKAVFLEMFGDPVVNSKKWPIMKFNEVGTLDRGKSKHRPRNAPELLGGKYPLIQTGEVANSEGYIKTFTQTYSEIGLKQSRMWPIGTLCITIAANIAKTGILTFEACFPDSIVGFTPNEKVRTEYIQVWMGFLQKILEDKAPESAQKNINLEILRNLDIPVPSIELQNKFFEIIQNTQDLKGKMLEQEKELDNQFQVLMQKSFIQN